MARIGKIEFDSAKELMEFIKMGGLKAVEGKEEPETRPQPARETAPSKKQTPKPKTKRVRWKKKHKKFYSEPQKSLVKQRFIHFKGKIPSKTIRSLAKRLGVSIGAIYGLIQRNKKSWARGHPEIDGKKKKQPTHFTKIPKLKEETKKKKPKKRKKAKKKKAQNGQSKRMSEIQKLRAKLQKEKGLGFKEALREAVNQVDSNRGYVPKQQPEQAEKSPEKPTEVLKQEEKAEMPVIPPLTVQSTTGLVMSLKDMMIGRIQKIDLSYAEACLQPMPGHPWSPEVWDGFLSRFLKASEQIKRHLGVSGDFVVQMSGSEQAIFFRG